MDRQGTVVVRLVTSAAMLPLQGATVTITKTLPDGTAQLLAVRVTDFDGLTDPVTVDTPPMASSQSYQAGTIPYSVVNIRIEREGFDRILIENAQVFPETETRQELSMIPTPNLPSSFDRTKTFVIPPQTL